MTEPGGEASIPATLEALERLLLEPAVRAAPDRVAALLDDDFVEFGSSGAVYDKPAIVATVARAPVAVTAGGFAVRALAEGVALVTYWTEPRDGDRSWSANRSSIWRLRQGRWTMLFHQGTPVPPA